MPNTGLSAQAQQLRQARRTTSLLKDLNPQTFCIHFTFLTRMRRSRLRP